MDFLIARIPGASRIVPRKLDPYRLSQRGGGLGRRTVGSSVVFAPGSTLPRDGMPLTIFDGYLVNGATLHHSLLATVPQLPSHSMGVTNGVYCSISVASNGEINATTDIAGQYILFYYSKANQFAISNNSHLIERALSLSGTRLRRAPLALAYSLAYGTNYGSHSAVEGINVAPPRHDLIAQPDGPLRTVERIKLKELFLPSGDGYKAELVRATSELTSTALAFAGAPLSRRLCDLTGGVDSRLALASVIAAGAKEEVQVYSSARHPQADRVVVDYLVHKYGLSEDRSALTNSTEAISFEESIARGVFRNFGLKLTDRSDVGDLYDPWTGRMSGYFGETSRTFGPAWSGERSCTGIDLARFYFHGRGADSMYLTDLGRHVVLESIGRYLDSLLSEGLPPQQALRSLYVEHRSRFHFGLTARLANLVRISVHPLYSIGMIRAAGHLGFQDLKDNRVGFDLISRLVGTEFALEPQAGARWPESVVPERLRTAYAETPAIYAGDNRLGNSPRVPRRTSPDFAATMARAGREGRFRLIPAMQSMLRSLLGDLSPNDDLWMLVDRAQLISIAEADPSHLESGRFGAHGRLVAANVAVATGGLVWYTRQEQPASVEKSAEPPS